MCSLPLAAISRISKKRSLGMQRQFLAVKTIVERILIRPINDPDITVLVPK
jgi:hypothetical protein